MTNSSSYRVYHMQVRSNYTAPDTVPASARLPQLLINIVKRNWLNYCKHTSLWSLLYFFPAALFFIFNLSGFSLFQPANPVYLLSFLLIIVFFYLNYYWLLPAFITKKIFIAYCIAVTVFIAVISSFEYMAAVSFSGAGNAAALPVLPEMMYIFVLLTIAVLSSVIVHMNRVIAAGKKEMDKMKVSLMNTQINPHFLFNSLNWIYMLAIAESKETPEAIIQLSGLMRYIIKESGSGFIDLKKELDYIRNYISLQKGRLGNTVSLNYSAPAYKGQGRIAPLLAMSFIENAFKHGINPDEDSVISIDITVDNNRFCMQVINNKVAPLENTICGGDGIRNAQDRLNKLYPMMHQLEILEDWKIYSVKLSMNIL